VGKVLRQLRALSRELREVQVQDKSPVFGMRIDSFADLAKSMDNINSQNYTEQAFSFPMAIGML
jgi:hypothetical protein